MTPERQREFHEFADKQLRNTTIEECARVVDGMYWNIATKATVAAAIRALKDKP